MLLDLEGALQVLFEGGGRTGGVRTEAARGEAGGGGGSDARPLLVRIGQPEVLQELWQNSCRTLARLHFDQAT